MKKQISLMLSMVLISVALTACGNKDNPEEESITRIEASNAAESKEPTERKYEDTTKEPVVAPDRNNSTESSEELINTDISDIDMSIYGNWFEDDGSAFSIYKEDDEIVFSGYDAETDRGLFGTVQSDEETFIEFKQNKAVDEEETTEEEETIPEDINIDDLGDGYSYDPEKGIQQEVNVIDQYGSEEEFNKAMQEENKQIEDDTLNNDNYEVIRYSIESKEVDTSTKQVIMTISNESKTYILRRNIDM